MTAWKYFTEKEVAGLVDDLVFKLDRARGFFGWPFVITSGYRSPSQNMLVGGVRDSSHEKGMAVDIRCANNEMQKKLCWALGAAGFQRIGVYTRHLHVDVDKEKPSPAYWIGESH